MHCSFCLPSSERELREQAAREREAMEAELRRQEEERLHRRGRRPPGAQTQAGQAPGQGKGQAGKGKEGVEIKKGAEAAKGVTTERTALSGNEGKETKAERPDSHATEKSGNDEADKKGKKKRPKSKDSTEEPSDQPQMTEAELEEEMKFQQKYSSSAFQNFLLFSILKNNYYEFYVSF